MTRITKYLLLVSFVAVLFDLARFFIHGSANPFYLIWNLFLAWIPYFISVYFIKKDLPTNRFVPFFILWLLFFPNAPYLATDVLHIAFSPPVFLWFDSLLFFFFGWIGLLLGMLSLFQIHQYLKIRFRRPISDFFIFIICLVASFGVYLGRFERWNSWDIFISPLKLARHSLDFSANLTRAGTSLAFTLLFTVFIYSVYQAVYVLLEQN
jgi:uncharacterized membrane protein